MTISQASLDQAEKLIPKGTPNRKGVVRKVAMALEEEYDKGFQRANLSGKTWMPCDDR